jgi:hypothetical protein
MRSRRSRGVLGALLVGYGAFGIVFTRHISTHNYYSLALVPIAALALAALVAFLEPLVSRTPRPVAALLSAGAVAAIAVWAVQLHGRLSDPAYGRQGREYRQVGSIVNHTASSIFLAADFGLPLEYEGRLTGRFWPTVPDARTATPAARFEGRDGRPWPAVAEMQPPPTAFIVTNREEFADQPELRRYLNRRYRQIAATPSYLIYDLSLPSTAGAR